MSPAPVGPLYGTVYGADGSDTDFNGVDFVSFVTDKTYGKPAIIAPGTDDFQAASDLGRSVTVLYVNPGQVQALQVTKVPD